MHSQQAVTAPNGVSTFGSNTLRTAPDIAIVVLVVSLQNPSAKKAFSDTQRASANVKSMLKRFDGASVKTSRVNLSEERNWQTQKFIGYTASLTFRIVVTDLDIVEDLIMAGINAGVTNIADVSYQTTKLKELRAQARRNAIRSAKEKAETYCHEMDAKVGKLLHIEDVNPDSLERGGREQRSYMAGAAADVGGEDEAPSTIDPDDIKVAGAVRAVFEILN